MSPDFSEPSFLKGGYHDSGDHIDEQFGEGNFGFDELLVTHDRAVKPITIKNTGKTDLMLLKFFGPDINKDIPMIKKWKR